MVFLWHSSRHVSSIVVASLATSSHVYFLNLLFMFVCKLTLYNHHIVLNDLLFLFTKTVCVLKHIDFFGISLLLLSFKTFENKVVISVEYNMLTDFFVCSEISTLTVKISFVVTLSALF